MREYRYYSSYLNTNISLMSDDQVRRMEKRKESAAPIEFPKSRERKDEKQELEENK